MFHLDRLKDEGFFAPRPDISSQTRLSPLSTSRTDITSPSQVLSQGPMMKVRRIKNFRTQEKSIENHAGYGPLANPTKSLIGKIVKTGWKGGIPGYATEMSSDYIRIPRSFVVITCTE